jgi:hypothetical protein
MDLIGGERVELALTGIATRALALELAWQAAFRAQERAQQAPFAGNHLVKSGALRASLTQPAANGALREAHSLEATFGTTVRYARAAASRAGTNVLVDPVDEIADLTLHYVTGEL